MGKSQKVAKKNEESNSVARARPEKISRNKRREYLGNAGITLLPFIGWMIFSAVPIVLSLIMVFFSMRNSSFEGATFVGFDNFVKLFTQYKTKLGYSILNTLVYSLKLPIGIIISIWISTMLNKVKNRTMKNTLRTVFFVTYICSISVIIIAFRMIIDEGSGVFNSILNSVGMKGFGWLTSSPWAFHLSAMLIGVWSSIGYNVVMFQAAMSSIDVSYYESAQIDGASQWTCFWKITMPAITPTLSFVITTGLIGCFQAYGETQVLAMGANGIPEWPNSQYTGPWITCAMWIYNMMFESPAEYGFGMAATSGWVLAIFIFIIIRFNMKLQRKWVCYDF